MTRSKTGIHRMMFDSKTKSTDTEMPTTATKKVVLVGHCGPDSSYLRMAVMKADKALEVLMAARTHQF